MTKQCKSGSTAFFSKSSEDSLGLRSLVLNFYFAIQCVNYDLDTTKWTCKHQINLQMPTKYTLLLIPSEFTKLKSYIQVLETILRQRCHEHRKYYKDHLLFQMDRSFACYTNCLQHTMANKYFMLSMLLPK